MIIDQRLLFCRQHACSKGKSTETALYELVGYIEVTLNVKEHTMVILFFIDGAFNNINPSAIITVLSNICDNENILLLVGNLLTKRPISAKLEPIYHKLFVCHGSPQRGVISQTSLERSDEQPPAEGDYRKCYRIC